MKVVLASSSPRRKQLLKQIRLSFLVDPSSVNEDIDENISAVEIVKTLARRKGLDIATKYSNALVIAADTIVWFENQMLGKPENKQQAITMLRRLSGNTHSVYTGVWVGLTSGESLKTNILFSERTKVTFETLTQEEIDAYISNNHPYDKAGAYGIQDDMGCLFVKKIDGDYNNVVGFPLFTFYQQLKIHLPDIHRKLFFRSKHP